MKGKCLSKFYSLTMVRILEFYHLYSKHGFITFNIYLTWLGIENTQLAGGKSIFPQIMRGSFFTCFTRSSVKLLSIFSVKIVIVNRTTYLLQDVKNFTHGKKFLED